MDDHSANTDSTANPPLDPRAVLGGVLVACGIKPPTEPEPDAVREALRGVLHELVVDCWPTIPERVREAIDFTRMSSNPRMSRYWLAKVLSERPQLPPDEVLTEPDGTLVARRTWKPDDGDRAHMGDPDPENPPKLPAELVGPALTLLASMEVAEARRDPTSFRGTHNAYNVLNVVVGESRWSDDIRAEMHCVLRPRDAPRGQLPSPPRSALSAGSAEEAKSVDPTRFTLDVEDGEDLEINGVQLCYTDGEIRRPIRAGTVVADLLLDLRDKVPHRWSTKCSRLRAALALTELDGLSIVRKQREALALSAEVTLSPSARVVAEKRRQERRASARP